MKRYSKDPYCRCCMEPDDSGAWVMFEDIAPHAGWEDDLDATLRARQAEIERLRGELQKYRNQAHSAVNNLDFGA